MTESWIDSLDRQQATLAAYRITSLICCWWRNKIILFFCINKMFFGFPYFFLIPNYSQWTPRIIEFSSCRNQNTLVEWVGDLIVFLVLYQGLALMRLLVMWYFFSWQKAVCCVPLSRSSCIVNIEKKKEEFHFLFRKWLKLWGCILWALWNDNIPFHDLSIYFTRVEQTATLFII